jgi:hypothetical protein
MPRSCRSALLASLSLCGLCLSSFAADEPKGDPAFRGGRITFANLTWDIKKGDKLGPGGNAWSAAKENVRVDDKGHLHLAITPQKDGKWHCAEVRGTRSLGYGDYRWVIAGNLAGLDKQAVLGLFLYQDDEREIDFELSRWAGKGETWNAQFAVMPSEDDALMLKKGRLSRFDTGKARLLTVSLRWTRGRVQGRCWSGEETKAKPIADWTYDWRKGHKEIEVGTERCIMDLWLIKAKEPSDGKSQEVVVRTFTFTPIKP